MYGLSHIGFVQIARVDERELVVRSLPQNSPQKQTVTVKVGTRSWMQLTLALNGTALTSAFDCEHFELASANQPQH